MEHLEQQLEEIVALENRLHEARRAARDRFEDVRKARAVVAQRIHLWQTDGQPPLTPEQNVRNWIKSNQEAKARRAAGLQEPVGRNTPRSYIDRIGSYAHSGDANDFARARMQRGFRRGSLTKTQAAHADAVRARQPKLPSER